MSNHPTHHYHPGSISGFRFARGDGDRPHSFLGTRRRVSLLLCLALLSFAVPLRAEQRAAIGWDRSADPAVAGYVVYYGNTPHSYSNRVDVGTNTSITITGLKEGTTNYIAVASYNVARMESAPSSELAYFVPGVLRAAPRTSPTAPAALTFAVTPGHWYEIQAATDLKSWTTIGQTSPANTNAWVQFLDPKAPLFPQRFYRLILH